MVHVSALLVMDDVSIVLWEDEPHVPRKDLVENHFLVPFQSAAMDLLAVCAMGIL